MQEVLMAQDKLQQLGVAADVWSVTSYNELYRDAIAAEEATRANPAAPRQSFLTETLAGVEGPFIAVTDYMRSLPESISRWIPGQLVSLGTDGFGLSDSRPSLREHFKVDATSIVDAALDSLR